MAWEERNGSLYYYYKERNGKRIMSSYSGAGEMAEALSRAVEKEQKIRAMLRARKREQLEREREMDALLDDLVDGVHRLVAAELVAHGYHEHKGQWRKKRDERSR